MELEDLKSIWKQNEPSYKPKNEQEIALMLRGKSMSIIDKLKRSVWLDFIITVVVSVALLVYAISLPSGALKWTSISLLLMCLAFTIYYIKKLTLLNRFVPNENLQSTITTLIARLDNYLKFYKNSYAILYPVFFLLGLLFGAMEKGPAVYIEYLSRTSIIIYLVLMAGLFFFLSSWFANWYLKKLYGDHVEKLRKLLDELQGFAQTPS
jgi:hypothetical protein